MLIAWTISPADHPVGCDLTSHSFLQGTPCRAQTSAWNSRSPRGSPVIGAFESRQHNWTESGATWATYDGTNAWGTSGARGWERGALLTSTTVDSSYSGGDRVNWNVTQAVQSAMRKTAPWISSSTWSPPEHRFEVRLALRQRSAPAIEPR